MNKPSRRAVVRTGVWAVPVVATAAAVPAFAVSGGGCAGSVCLNGEGSSCKLPGHSTHDGSTWYGYRMHLTFTNDSGVDQLVNVTGVDFGKATDTVVTYGGPYNVPASCTTASGGCSDFVLIVQSTNSAQQNATICFTAEGQSACVNVFFPSFNPCKCEPKDADPTDPNADCA